MELTVAFHVQVGSAMLA